MHNTKALVLLSLLATPAFAQPTEVTSRAIPAVENAFELALGASSSYGRGGLGDTMPALQDVASPGLGIDIGLGYRATPNLLFGAYVSLGGYGHPDNNGNGAVTAALGLKADFHFSPTAKLDPWVSVGTGIKVLAIQTDDDTERALTGLELAKVQVGLDYRMSPRFAIGPFAGASATLYRHAYDDTMSDDAIDIEKKDINWTFSAGVLGRFDFFGDRRE